MKIFTSGRKVMVVPVREALGTLFSSFARLISLVDFPAANSIACTCPSRRTSACRYSLSALTTETPTPCRPEETLYPESPNLPPAWRTVSTVSSAGRPVFSCKSHGIPRPSSFTVTLPSACSSTSIAVACPASASSTELSTTS